MRKRGADIGIEQFFLNKKSQITLYIIIGIILLLSIGTVIYIRNVSVDKNINVIPVIEQVPLQFNPVREYVSNCIYDIAKEGLEKLGEQGGYIETEKFGIIGSAIIPTESDAVQFSPGSDLNIPYWWYLSSSNKCAGNCKFDSKKPELKRKDGTRQDTSIEAQLDWYVTDNLKNCLDDFSAFIAEGFDVTEKGDIKTTTIVNDYDIGILVDYPIEAKIGEAATDIKQYYVTLHVNFKKMYQLADEISNAEKDYNFIERNTLNLMTGFGSLGDNALPPKAETTFDFGTGKIWSTQKVKNQIEGMLAAYVPGLQVFSTANYERNMFYGDDIKQAVYDQMVVPMNLDNIYDDYEVRFDYLDWWPIYFDAGEGGIIKADGMNIPFLNFGVQRYDVPYDISFPAVVTVDDPYAFNGEGYAFRFAVEANIRNNEPIEADFDGGGGVAIFQSSLLCNENQKTSGNVTIKAKDMSDNDPLYGVNVVFTCGKESCYIGKTDLDGELKSQYPVCYNGIMTFLKQDYFVDARKLTTELEKEQKLSDIKLYPYIEKKISVEKWRYSPRFKQLSTSTLNVEPYERAIISLTKIKENPGEEDVFAVAEFNGNDTILPTLRLVPGIYEVRINLLTDMPLLIPEEKRKTGGGLFSSAEEIKIPEININDTYPSGGAELNDKAGYLTIRSQDLYSDNKIMFYVISPEIPKTVEELSLISDIEKFSIKYRAYLEPAYKK